MVNHRARAFWSVCLYTPETEACGFPKTHAIRLQTLKTVNRLTVRFPRKAACMYDIDEPLKKNETQSWNVALGYAKIEARDRLVRCPVNAP